ncbi:unnamed protein product [Moneuplotes crassus]|uniref:chitin synthase n=1 Tax=Euplotes crassus TaxID=5936 RepID=A0AAD2DC67_EUPCR|nr:unnamed protein product [Moneuplotes crassus]
MTCSTDIVNRKGSQEESKSNDRDEEQEEPPKLQQSGEQEDQDEEDAALTTRVNISTSLEYNPLLCFREEEKKQEEDKCTIVERTKLMKHLGDLEQTQIDLKNLKSIYDSSSLISDEKGRRMHQLVCITMYNEPYLQIFQTLVGIYRNYYELLEIDKQFRDRLAIVIICDGYQIFTKETEETPLQNWQRYQMAGLYDPEFTKSYLKTPDEKDSDKSPEYMNIEALKNCQGLRDSNKYYDLETSNLAHCYSRSMYIGNFLQGLTDSERKKLKVDELLSLDFLFGNQTTTKITTYQYEAETFQCYFLLVKSERSVFSKKYPINLCIFTNILHFYLKICLFSVKFWLRYEISSHISSRSMPIDVHLVIKHRNMGKIESHLWFFKGFCNTLNPEITTILDAGTIPMWKSISHMTMYMELYKDVGAVCGEIEVILTEKNDDGKEVTFFQSVLLRSQYGEYKLSHYLDKAAESFFGYISVLPGAFSMFRWECIKEEPLEEFLKGTSISDPSKPYPSCWEGNKFLAEDRIMPMEIISKKNENFVIKYVPGCKAKTDAPNNFITLIKQRRRWFNGSLFATLYVFTRIMKVKNRKRDKCCFWDILIYWLFFIYMFLNTLLGLLIVGLHYATYSIFVRSIFYGSKCNDVFVMANFLEYLYLAFLFFIFLFSICIRLEYCREYFKGIAAFMGFFSFMMTIVVLAVAMNLKLSEGVYIAIAGLVCTYLFPMVLNFSDLKLMDFIKGTIYIFFMIPTYINIMTIYSIANIHDVTWGSRGSSEGFKSESKRDRAQRIDYENFRFYCLLIWSACNAIFSRSIIYLSQENEQGSLSIIVTIFGALIVAKLVFSFIYQMHFKRIRSKLRKNIKKLTKESGYKHKVGEYIESS